MLEFSWPWMSLMLPLPLLVWWLLPAYRQRVSALRIPFFNRIASAASAQPGAGSVVVRRRPLQVATGVLVWILLVTASARPQWVGEPIVRTQAARDIMLAIDLSGSMDYRDFPTSGGDLVTRFEAVQRVIRDFVAERAGDRVGLIVFGDRAYLQLPFTQDLATAGALVDLMQVGMAGPRTAIGDAIGLSIHAFENSEVEQRVLILLTDGNDTASKMTPINAAEIAALQDVQVHTIGIGDHQATGEDRVDFAVLEQIAQRTGGSFFDAKDQDALARVYLQIDAATKAELKTESWRPRDSLVHWPLGIAVLLIVLTQGLLLLVTRPQPGRQSSSQAAASSPSTVGEQP